MTTITTSSGLIEKDLLTSQLFKEQIKNIVSDFTGYEEVDGIVEEIITAIPTTKFDNMGELITSIILKK